MGICVTYTHMYVDTSSLAIRSRPESNAIAVTLSMPRAQSSVCKFHFLQNNNKNKTKKAGVFEEILDSRARTGKVQNKPETVLCLYRRVEKCSGTEGRVFKEHGSQLWDRLSTTRHDGNRCCLLRQCPRVGRHRRRKQSASFIARLGSDGIRKSFGVVAEDLTTLPKNSSFKDNLQRENNQTGNRFLTVILVETDYLRLHFQTTGDIPVRRRVIVHM